MDIVEGSVNRIATPLTSFQLVIPLVFAVQFRPT